MIEKQKEHDPKMDKWMAAHPILPSNEHNRKKWPGPEARKSGTGASICFRTCLRGRSTVPGFYAIRHVRWTVISPRGIGPSCRMVLDGLDGSRSTHDHTKRVRRPSLIRLSDMVRSCGTGAGRVSLALGCLVKVGWSFLSFIYLAVQAFTALRGFKRILVMRRRQNAFFNWSGRPPSRRA